MVLIVLQAITGGIAHAQSYSETILHSFANTPDGAYPADDVFLADAQGNVYGTTQIGGVSGNGTVFKVALLGLQPYSIVLPVRMGSGRLQVLSSANMANCMEPPEMAGSMVAEWCSS